MSLQRNISSELFVAEENGWDSMVERARAIEVHGLPCGLDATNLEEAYAAGNAVPPPVAKCPSHYIRWKGRDYRIYKKKPRAAATWYYSYYENGVRQPLVNLQTPDRATAEETLKLFLQGQQRGLLEQMRALLDGHVVVTTPGAGAAQGIKLAAYLTAYENTPTGNNSPNSRKICVQKIQLICAAYSKPVHFVHELLPACQAYRLAANAKIEKESDQGRQLSLKRSFNSVLRLTSATFCDSAVAALDAQYPDADFTTLRAGIKKLFFGNAKKTAIQYRAPAQALLDKTLEEWLKLPRNDFVAVGIALAFGLRSSEFAAGNWSWIREFQGFAMMDATGNFKDLSGVLRVRGLDPFYSILMQHARAKGWWTKDGPFLVDTFHSTRSTFYRGVGQWMRGLGWRTQKHLHALRAWAGSLVYTRYGASAAKNFLRHSDEVTTRNHYGWLRDDWATEGAEIKVAGKLVEWAKI